jgi:hypothetical protein
MLSLTHRLLSAREQSEQSTGYAFFAAAVFLICGAVDLSVNALQMAFNSGAATLAAGPLIALVIGAVLYTVAAIFVAYVARYFIQGKL